MIAAIRERRLVQWTLSYVAGAFLALEALDMFTERGYLHALFYDLGLIWAVIAGLPAAVIIGWFHGEKGDQKAPRLEWGLLSGLAVLGIGLSLATVVASRADAVAPLTGTLDARSVAVLYFRADELPESERYIADALTEDLISELSTVRALKVVSRNGSQEVRGLDVARDSIARVLQAGTLVEGALERRGDRLLVSLRLFDGNSGVEYKRALLESSAAELLAVRDQLVEESSRLLREALGEEIALRTAGSGTRVQEAWSLVQQAERLRKAGVTAATNDVDRANHLFDEADQLLARAEALDTAWVEPTILRSEVALRRVRANLDQPLVASAAARVGIEHAEQALRGSRNHPRALELRGSNTYFLHMLRVTGDPGRQAALRDAARSDLQRAVQLDPGLASAHALLSHLLQGEEQVSAGVIAAQRAYEEDAFLESAPVVLWRLYTGNYNLASFTQAQRWCEEGVRRFPHDWRFTWCQLDLMTTPSAVPDADRGWALVASLDSLAPAADRSFRRIQAELAMAAVLGRLALADSARAVIARARNSITPGLDPDGSLTWDVAYGYLSLGDADEAIAVLHRAIAVSQHAFRSDGEISWRWRELQGHPRFTELTRSH
jgi:eukaryotic-like serine/threonine-protein kinase